MIKYEFETVLLGSFHGIVHYSTVITIHRLELFDCRFVSYSFVRVHIERVFVLRTNCAKKRRHVSRIASSIDVQVADESCNWFRKLETKESCPRLHPMYRLVRSESSETFTLVSFIFIVNTISRRLVGLFTRTRSNLSTMLRARPRVPRKTSACHQSSQRLRSISVPAINII